MESSDSDGESNWTGREMIFVTELTRDGQIVSCEFITSNEPHQLNGHRYYLSLDSDDRLFVTDTDNHRVILFDSDLMKIRILCLTNEANEERDIRFPNRLFCHKELKQLIVGGSYGNEVNVYTLSQT